MRACLAAIRIFCLQPMQSSNSGIKQSECHHYRSKLVASDFDNTFQLNLLVNSACLLARTGRVRRRRRPV